MRVGNPINMHRLYRLKTHPHQDFQTQPSNAGQHNKDHTNRCVIALKLEARISNELLIGAFSNCLQSCLIVGMQQAFRSTEVFSKCIRLELAVKVRRYLSGTLKSQTAFTVFPPSSSDVI